MENILVPKKQILAKQRTDKIGLGKKFYIETVSEDDKLNEVLNKNKWKIKEERVLLGRSIWKRQHGHKLKSIEINEN